MKANDVSQNSNVQFISVSITFLSLTLDCASGLYVFVSTKHYFLCVSLDLSIQIGILNYQTVPQGTITPTSTTCRLPPRLYAEKWVQAPRFRPRSSLGHRIGLQTQPLSLKQGADLTRRLFTEYVQLGRALFLTEPGTTTRVTSF